MSSSSLRVSLEPVENVKPSPGVSQTWNEVSVGRWVCKEGHQRARAAASLNGAWSRDEWRVGYCVCKGGRRGGDTDQSRHSQLVDMSAHNGIWLEEQY